MAKEKYPTIEEARSAGLWHPNCGHSVSVYVPGFTPAIKTKPNPQGYKDKQKQRSNERQIRKWKKRAAVAITPKDKAAAQTKVREWQKKQREYLEGKDLKRDYSREKIYTAETT